MALPNFTLPKQFAAKICAIALILSAQAILQLPAHAQTQAFRLAVFGDSLSAGYRLAEKDGYPKVLERALRARGHAVEVVSASVSGDTSTGGLARLDWALHGKINGVIVQLGANDMLRGIDPAKTQQALDAIITRIKAKGARVLLAGMIAAPGMGKIYENRFNAIFPELAKKHKVPLIPFFLEGIASKKSLNLADGIHPNPEGVRIMVRNSLPLVEELVAGKKPAL